MRRPRGARSRSGALVSLLAAMVAGTAEASAQETVRVSVDSSGAEADNDSYGYVSVLSADGRFVVFSSIATNLVPNDMNGFCDLFVHDRSTGTTQRVSVDSNGAEGNADAQAWEFTISADGSSVAFEIGRAHV